MLRLISLASLVTDAIACVGLNVVTDTGAAVSVYLDDISAQRWVNGRYEEALSFDGVDDYVSISTISTAKTQEGWFYFTKLAKTKTNNNHLFNNLYQHSANNYLYLNGTGDYIPWIPSINTWYHLVLTFTDSSDTNTVKFYVNGGAPYSVTQQGEPHSIQVVSQISGSGTNNAFHGLIDEVRIYNRTLSAEEIKAHYYGNLHSKDGTIEMWVKPNWAGSDTNNRYFLDAQGLSLYKDTASNLKLTVGSLTASTSISGWSANEWHYLSGTWDEGAGTVCIYVDGIQKNCNINAHDWTNLSDFFYLGSDDSQPSGNQAAAVIDGLKISNVARSAEEIRAAYEIQKEQIAPSVQGDRKSVV